jgi:predicted DNA-binding transcriptional regulator AlpA
MAGSAFFCVFSRVWSMQRSKQAKSPDSGNVAVRAARPLVFKVQLLEMLGGISPSTLWEWMKAGSFPCPIELGPSGGRGSACAWYLDEIDDWLATRPRRQIGQGLHPYVGRREEGDAEPVQPAHPKPKPKMKRTAAARAVR